MITDEERREIANELRRQAAYSSGSLHCSSCDWSGQLWEYIGFGDMLAYEPVHCPKCGEKIERVGELVPGA